MTIRGRKEFLIALTVISFTTFTILGLFFLTHHRPTVSYWPHILMLFFAWFFIAVIFFKNYFTYYILDSAGITEHFFSRTRTLRWEECRFIRRIVVRGSWKNTSENRIVCSRHAPPAEYDDFRLSKYRWPRKDTFNIRNASDEIYEEFLKWCGGEKDIRTEADWRK